MQVRPATFPSIGVDCVTALDAVRCAALRSAGVGFAVRYLGSLTVDEVGTILEAGLALMPVTYSRAPGWVPTHGMGTADGMQDLAHMQAAGLDAARDCTVWIDLEGCAGSAGDAAAWVTERSAVLHVAGYDVGLYVGAYQPLDGAQLYALPGVTKYWRSLSSGVPEPECGWCLIQLFPTTTIGGTSVDVDVVQHDHKGRVPMVVSA